MNACQKGAVVEMFFYAEAGKKGWDVYVPLGHSHAADVIIFKPPASPVSVQIKTATYNPQKDSYGVMASRGLGPRVAYCAGDFDILAAWLPQEEKFVLWRFDEIRERKKIYYTPRLHRQPDNWELLESVLK
jgi:hypothetical protein